MKREECLNCLRPSASCFCPYINCVTNATPILILQHPSEKNHPLNTVKIAKMSFSNIQVLNGEDFSGSQELKSFIDLYQPHLIFPTSEAIELTETTPNPKINALILIDGTWRKAKKIYYSNQILVRLPKIVLKNGQKSIYTIRKEPKSYYLSTLETIVYTLERIENRNFQKVLEPMNYQIEYQINKMGTETFKKNYKLKESD